MRGAVAAIFAVLVFAPMAYAGVELASGPVPQKGDPWNPLITVPEASLDYSEWYGDNRLVIRHGFGQPIENAWMTDRESNYVSVNMKLLVNGGEVRPLVVRATANGATVDLPQESAQDFAAGDWIEVELHEPLEMADVIQLIWAPEDLTLTDRIVQ